MIEFLLAVFALDRDNVPRLARDSELLFTFCLNGRVEALTFSVKSSSTSSSYDGLGSWFVKYMKFFGNLIVFSSSLLSKNCSLSGNNIEIFFITEGIEIISSQSGLLSGLAFSNDRTKFDNSVEYLFWNRLI